MRRCTASGSRVLQLAGLLFCQFNELGHAFDAERRTDNEDVGGLGLRADRNDVLAVFVLDGLRQEFVGYRGEGVFKSV